MKDTIYSKWPAINNKHLSEVLAVQIF